MQAASRDLDGTRGRIRRACGPSASDAMQGGVEACPRRPGVHRRDDHRASTTIRRDHRPTLRCDELEAMLIYSMSVSVDGFIADRGAGSSGRCPARSSFVSHRADARARRLSVRPQALRDHVAVDTDPSMRSSELGAAFADVWCAIPKVVFSRTLHSVQGNARLAAASLAEEAPRRSRRPKRTSRSAAPA